MVNTTPADEARLSRNEAYLGKLAKVSDITICAQGEEVPASLMALCGDLEIRVPMAGVVDIGAEVKRLDRDIERRKQEVAKLSGKLSNEAFVARAPAEIVATEQQKLDQAESALSTLQRQRSQIEELRSD